MFKRTQFTTISPLPANISRQVVLDFLHDHQEMIDLNPLVIDRHPIAPPPHAPPEELECVWYSLTDKISYLPGGLYTGDVTYTCAFNDLRNGLQTHCYAPAGLTIRDRWTVNGSLPDEPSEPIELGIGAPLTGLYIREDVDMRCNILLTTFVKKTLKNSHAALIERLKAKAQIASGGVPLPQQQLQQGSLTVSGNGSGKLDSLGGLSLMDSSGSSFDSGYGAGTRMESTSWEVSGQQLKQAREAGMNRNRRSPSPATGKDTRLGVSAQTMKYYEQSLQPRVPSPAMQWQQQQQQRSQQHASPPPQSTSTNPPLPYPTTPNPQSQPQLHLTGYQQPPHPSPPPKSTPYPQTPARQPERQRTPSRERQRQIEHSQLVPSPLRLPSTSPRERNGNPNSRMAQQQRESCLFSGSENSPPPPPSGKAQSQEQGQGESLVGATLKGPFILAELP